MEIISSTPEQIGIKLSFLKPWKATNDVTFTLAPTGQRDRGHVADDR